MCTTAAHIDLHHFQQPVQTHLVKLAVGAETRIVHQQIDDDVLFFGERKNLLRTERLRQIRDANERADLMLGAQFRRQARRAGRAAAPSAPDSFRPQPVLAPLPCRSPRWRQ